MAIGSRGQRGARVVSRVEAGIRAGRESVMDPSMVDWTVTVTTDRHRAAMDNLAQVRPTSQNQDTDAYFMFKSMKYISLQNIYLVC